jgi:hypothetical protein
MSMSLKILYKIRKVISQNRKITPGYADRAEKSSTPAKVFTSLRMLLTILALISS